MMPGTPEIVKCPSCKEKQQRPTLISGNTFGASYYSDGKRIAPMLPQYPYFVKCPKCTKFFKIAHEEIAREMSFDRDSIIPFVKFLTVDELLQAIESGLVNGNDDDILSLRIELWQTFNDSIRDGQKEIPRKELYEDNCRKILSELTEQNNDETYLTCAELWRNIGEFNQCASFLGKINSSEKFKDYISAINAACDVQNTLTVCV
jgi:hypothetical protein